MNEASKPCSTCGEVKPLAAFSTDRRHADGRQSRCLICHRAYQNLRKREQPDRYREQRRAEHRRRVASGSVEAWRAENRDQINEWRRRWLAGLSEEQREQMTAKARIRSATYRQSNADLCNERIARWKRANPGMSRHYVHVRRAKTRGREAAERFTRQEIGDRDGWICGICGEPVDPALRWPEHASQSLDHVLPLSLGGEHTRANSRISHYICNVRRGARVRTEVAEARKEAERGSPTGQADR